MAQMGTASTSMLQRRLRLGYTRAGRLIDMLERRGIISGYEGSKPRQVLITEADVPRILSHLAEADGARAAASGPRPRRHRRRASSPLRGARERRRSPAVDGRSAASLRRRMADIGSTLREARMRARIDISEVEARTKIRAKYLRAIENEEWDLLPGPVYVKSFLRTYGDFLGLDSRLLSTSSSAVTSARADHDMRPIAPLGRERERKRRRPAARAAVAVIVLVLVGGRGRAVRGRQPQSEQQQLDDDPDDGHDQRAQYHVDEHAHHHDVRPPPRRPPPPPTTATLTAHADKRVVRLRRGRHRQHAHHGAIYAAGQTIPTETAAKLLVTLGNDAVQLKVNGRPYHPDRVAVGDRPRRSRPTAASPCAAGRAEPTCTMSDAAVYTGSGGRPRRDPGHRHRGPDRDHLATATGRGCPSGCASSGSTRR